MAYRLIAFGVLVIMLCSCNNNTKSKQVNQPKSGGELIEEAYKQEDWDLIISVGDTLLSDDDPHNISIAYAEALAFKGNIEKAINVLNRKIAQKPEDYYLYQTKGNIFAIIEKILGEKKKAIEKYMVATFLFAKNRYETEAYEMEKRILKLDPDYKDVKELMHDMGLE